MWRVSIYNEFVMKNPFIFFLALLIAESLSAQQILILDQNTRQPLAQVIIYNQDSSRQAVTDDRGTAELKGFVNDLKITFTRLGYHPATYAWAQLTQMDFVVYLEEKSFFVDEVIISASRFAEKKSDVPMKVEVISRKDLEFINQPTLADVLQNSGEVMVQKSQLGGGSPIIRGFEANKVLIVVDGIRMNNAIYRGGHLQNIITLDNAMLERVEVVFGPGSVVYGSDALGGVMHLRTKNPVLAFGPDESNVRLNGLLRYGTAAQEKTAHLDFNFGGHSWAALTSLTVADFADLQMGRQQPEVYADLGLRPWFVKTQEGVDEVVSNPNPYRQVPSAYSQYDVLQKILFRPSPSVAHSLNLQFSTSSDVPRYDRLTLGSASAPRFSEWYYGPQNRLLAAYHLSLTPKQYWYDQAVLTASYQHIVESRHDRRFADQNLDHRQETVGIIGLNVDLEKQLQDHELRYGLEINLNAVTSEATQENIITGVRLALDTRYPDGGSDMHTLGAYLTHTWEVSDQWILTDGVRINGVRLNSRFEDKQFFPFPFDQVTQKHLALNGSLGVVYKAGLGWQISLQGSSGFRAPNVDDLSKVFESSPGLFIVPNPDLKPERTYNLDLSVQKQISEKSLISWNGFYTLYRQAITTRPFSFNGQSTIFYDGQQSQVVASVNAQRAYLYGCSANLTLGLSENLVLESAFTYTFGRINTDSSDYPLDHIPPAFGKTGLRWSKKAWRAELFSLYHGWKRLKDYNIFGEDNVAYATAQGMPAWYTLNVRTSWSLNRNVQLQAAVENIFDRNYRVFASNISGPGRNVVLTLRAGF